MCSQKSYLHFQPQTHLACETPWPVEDGDRSYYLVIEHKRNNSFLDSRINEDLDVYQSDCSGNNPRYGSNLNRLGRIKVKENIISRRTQGNPLPLPCVDFYIVATQGVQQTLCMSRELIQWSHQKTWKRLSRLQLSFEAGDHQGSLAVGEKKSFNYYQTSQRKSMQFETNYK